MTGSKIVLHVPSCKVAELLCAFTLNVPKCYVSRSDSTSNYGLSVRKAAKPEGKWKFEVVYVVKYGPAYCGFETGIL